MGGSFHGYASHNQNGTSKPSMYGTVFRFGHREARSGTAGNGDESRCRPEVGIQINTKWAIEKP